MSAPPILQKVYSDHIEHFGEPTDSIVFDDGKPIIGFPSRIDILIWDSDDECDITTFATIGMSALPLPKTSHRAELHFSVRSKVSHQDKHNVARFLANLAMYPFHTGEALDWWHTLSNPGAIPLFKTANCVFLHPRFVKVGWDSIATDEAKIHVLNVIPITPEEKALRKVDAIVEKLAEIDMFVPR